MLRVLSPCVAGGRPANDRRECGPGGGTTAGSAGEGGIYEKSGEKYDITRERITELAQEENDENV